MRFFTWQEAWWEATLDGFFFFFEGYIIVVIAFLELRN